MSVRKAVQQLAEYNFKAYDASIKLDQNELPYDVSDEIKTEICRRIMAQPLNRYPERQGESLRAQLAGHLGISDDMLMLGNGSNTIIRRIIESCGIDQRVLTVKPTFAVYELDSHLLDPEALCAVALSESFELDVDALKAEMTQGSGVVFIANPAAPTGNLHGREELIELLEQAQTHNWTFVIDEAYYQFAGCDHLDLLKDYDNLILLRTFSKAYGLAGVRVGYCIGNPQLIAQVRKSPPQFSISSLQLITASCVLEMAQDQLSEYLSEAHSERERLLSGLRALGVECLDSVCNFFLMRFADPQAIHEALRERGVLVRRQDGLVSGALRVSVGNPQENDRFLAAMRDILS